MVNNSIIPRHTLGFLLLVNGIYGFQNISIFAPEYYGNKPKALVASQQTQSLAFDQFALGANKQFRGFVAHEKQIEKLRSKHQSLQADIQQSVFRSKALDSHIMLTQHFCYTDYANTLNEMNRDLAATQKELWQFESGQVNKFGLPLLDAEKIADKFSPSEQEYLYNELLKADVLYIKRNVLENCIAYNKNIMKQFQDKTKTIVQTFAQTLEKKPVYELAREETPQLRQDRIKLKGFVENHKKLLTPLIQKNKELQQKIDAFAASTKAKIAAHINAALSNKESLSFLLHEQQIVQKQIAILTEQINSYEDGILRIEAKLDYVTSMIGDYQKAYSDYAQQVLTTLAQHIDTSSAQGKTLAEALQTCIRNKSAVTTPMNHQLSAESQSMLKKHGVSKEIYAPTTGNTVQAHLTESVANILNTLPQAASSSDVEKAYEQATVLSCAHALDAIQFGNLDQALIATSFAHHIASLINNMDHPILETLKSIGRGIAGGISEINDAERKIFDQQERMIKGIVKTDEQLMRLGTSLYQNTLAKEIASTLSSPKSQETLPQESVEQVTKFVTTLLCPSPTLMAGGNGISAIARTWELGQKTVEACKNAMALEQATQSTGNALAQPVSIKGIQVPQHLLKEVDALTRAGKLQTTEEIASFVEHHETPLYSSLKEAFKQKGKERVVLATEHGGIGAEIKASHEAQEVARGNANALGDAERKVGAAVDLKRTEKLAEISKQDAQQTCHASNALDNSENINQTINNRQLTKHQPEKFGSIKEYWQSLMQDPAHDFKVTVKTIEEAMAGIAAETSGYLKGPLKRDPRGAAEFIDKLGTSWDVKKGISRAPNGKHIFNCDALMASITKELKLGENIILDLTQLEKNDFPLLYQGLKNTLSHKDAERIIVVFKNDTLNLSGI